MKKSSKKTSGLLGGFDFQPIFSEQTLSRSEPKEEEVSQTKPNNAEQAPIKPSDATDSHAQPSEAELSGIKPKQAKDSKSQPNDAMLGEDKPKKLKQAKEVQRLIEQGNIPGALAEAGLTKKKIPMPESHQGFSVRAGLCTLPTRTPHGCCLGLSDLFLTSKPLATEAHLPCSP